MINFFAIICSIIFSVNMINSNISNNTINNNSFETCDMYYLDYYNQLNYEVGVIIEKYDNSTTDYIDISCIYGVEEKIQTFIAIKSIWNLCDSNEKTILYDYIEVYGNAHDDINLINCYKEICYELFGTKFEETQITINSSSINTSYNPSLAINYAYKYYYNYNPNYYDFSTSGGDCANFVSQCLKAGGLNMTSGWYYNSSTDYSGSWIETSRFKKYWTDNSYATHTYNVDTYKSYFNSLNNYMNLQRGDVIMLCDKIAGFILPVHTIIITARTSSDILYSAHSNSRYNASLMNVLNTTDEYDALFFIDIRSTPDSSYK